MMYQNQLQQQQLFFAQQQQQQMMNAQFQPFAYGGAQGAQPFTPAAQPGLGFQPQAMQMPMPAYPHGQFGAGAPIFQPSASPSRCWDEEKPTLCLETLTRASLRRMGKDDRWPDVYVRDPELMIFGCPQTCVAPASGP